jgi:hypothetical protein
LGIIGELYGREPGGPKTNFGLISPDGSALACRGQLCGASGKGSHRVTGPEPRYVSMLLGHCSHGFGSLDFLYPGGNCAAV